MLKEEAFETPRRLSFHMHSTPDSYQLITLTFVTWLKTIHVKELGESVNHQIRLAQKKAFNLHCA